MFSVVQVPLTLPKKRSEEVGDMVDVLSSAEDCDDPFGVKLQYSASISIRDDAEESGLVVDVGGADVKARGNHGTGRSIERAIEPMSLLQALCLGNERIGFLLVGSGFGLPQKVGDFGADFILLAAMR
ncbi:hypothetical protein HMPREF2806_08610 [Corynebacterium sp. HMSC076G08]|nr:hypothetical protein HMPREF2806_08610 [Corynebacterium sp. HMSC076G08]